MSEARRNSGMDLGGGAASSSGGARRPLPPPTPLELAEPALEFTEEQTEAWKAEAEVYALYHMANKLQQWRMAVMPRDEASEREYRIQMADVKEQYQYWSAKRWPLRGAPLSYDRGDARNKQINAWLRASGCDSDPAIDCLLYAAPEAKDGNIFNKQFFEVSQAFVVVIDAMEMVKEGQSAALGELRVRLETLRLVLPKFLDGKSAPAVPELLAKLPGMLSRVSLESTTENHITPKEWEEYQAVVDALHTEFKVKFGAT